MKIANFTHKDLDGIGCPILLNNICEKLYVKYCGYEDIDTRVNEFIDSGKWKNYVYLFITDISVSEDTAEKINNIPELRDRTFLLDHHPTALGLNKYSWCTVETHIKEFSTHPRKTCGTYMVWEWLIKNHFATTKYAADFVEMVRRYDTWEWKEVYDDVRPYHLNMLFGLMGGKDFFEAVTKMLELDSDFTFSEQDRKLIAIEENKIERDVEKHAKNVFLVKVQDKLAAVCFAENYINDLAHAICTLHPQADMAIVIDMNNRTISYRTEKDNIDLGEFAMTYGGGGHPKAAGSQIDNAFHFDFMEKYFIKG